MQPWCTPFPVWTQCIVPLLPLTIASCPAYRFLRKQLSWSDILISLRISHSLLLSTQRLQHSQWRRYLCNSPVCDSKDVGHLISGSSVFSKSSFYIWKFLVQVLLKPSLKDFEHNLASLWDERNHMVIEHSLALSWGLEWKLTFLSPWTIAEFSKFAGIMSNTLSSTFRIWKSSVGIPSPPLALSIVMLSKAHLTSHSRMSGSRWVPTPLWLSGSLRPFLYISVYSCHLFIISSASVRLFVENI